MSIVNVTSNNRPGIFIASTSESLPVAKAVKSHFDNEADVDIWTENVFAINKSYLSTLLNRASFYDYAIILLAPGDTATIRGRQYNIPRDNLLFEFGLFLGRIGPNRTFAIAEERVKVLSDFEGISIAKYREGHLDASIGDACEKIRREMAVAEKIYTFSLLPSTSLAIGYYKNFLEKVADAFKIIDEYEIFEKDSKGKKINIQKREVKTRRPSITVLLPGKLSDLTATTLGIKTEHLKQVTVDTTFRPFPFYIAGDIADESNANFFDIPTTLLSSLETINRFFEKDFLERDNNFERIGRREISNFEKTIRILVPDSIENKLIKFETLA